MNFGARADMLALTKSRLEVLKTKCRDASLVDDMEKISVFLLLTRREKLFAGWAILACSSYHIKFSW
jgi:hypothetical protein